MTESTSDYKKRIEEIKQSIENEPYMAKMREDIAEGISKTGIRQATVEEQFQSVLDETTGKDVISAPEIIVARGGAQTLRERLDSEKAEVSAQLAQTGSEMANGLYKKTIDQTEELNAYFDTLSENGIRYADFKKDDEYIVDGDLTNAYKVIKIGNAKINKQNPNNWFTHISKSLGSFSEKINSFGLQNMKSNIDKGSFNQFTNALSQNREIKFSFITDSIGAGSMGNPDKFSTKVIAGTSKDIRLSTDGVVQNTSFVYKMMDLLKDSFPNTTFSINNYGVGGTKIDAWDSTVTYWGITKKWIDFCKDAKPDVLVVAFGMNSDDYNEASTFAYDLKSLMDYVNSNFNPIPDVVVIPTPRPIYIPGYGGYGTFSHHVSRYNVSNSARAIAKEYGAYVCDVGRLSDIKRIGLDYTKPIMKRLALSDFKEELNGTITKKSDNSYSFTNGSIGRLWLKENYQKDFTLKVTFNFTAPTANSQNALSINFNKVDTTGTHENRVEISPKVSTGFAKVKSAMRLANNTSWGDSWIQEYTDDVAYDGAEVTIIISKIADKLEVRKVGVDGYEYVLLQDYVDVWDVPGYFEFAYTPTGAGNTGTIKNIEINGAEYPEYLPTLTENEMWGEFIEGDATTKLPYGGNGLNHPSSIGISEVYEPALSEMVDDIVLLTTNSNRNDGFDLFPVTETKTSAVASPSVSYIAVDTKILSARLIKADGTTFKFNKNITGWAGYTIGGTLGENEFGMYMQSDTQARLIINSPASEGWEVTTYQ